MSSQHERQTGVSMTYILFEVELSFILISWTQEQPNLMLPKYSNTRNISLSERVLHDKSCQLIESGGSRFRDNFGGVTKLS